MKWKLNKEKKKMLHCAGVLIMSDIGEIHFKNAKKYIFEI